MTVGTRETSRARHAARRRRKGHGVLRIAAIVGVISALSVAFALTVVELSQDEPTARAIQRSSGDQAATRTGRSFTPASSRRKSRVLDMTPLAEPSSAAKHVEQPVSQASNGPRWQISHKRASLGESEALTPLDTPRGVPLNRASGWRLGGQRTEEATDNPSRGSAGSPSAFSSAKGFAMNAGGARAGSRLGRSRAGGTASPLNTRAIAPTFVASGPVASAPSDGTEPVAPAASPDVSLPTGGTSSPSSTPGPINEWVSPSTLVISSGPVQGVGPIANPVAVLPGGILAPGTSPGELTLLDDFVLSGGTLELDIWGYAPGTEYDLLTIEGSALFESGAFQFVFSDDESGDIFVPVLGDTFTFLTAQDGIFGFDGNSDLSILSLDLASDLDLMVTHSNNALTLEIIAASAAISSQEPSTSNGPNYVVNAGTATDQSALQTITVSAPAALALHFFGLAAMLATRAIRRRRIIRAPG
ncbi:MAG: hypothetical protein ACI9DC_002106 [Gammaproteobacteria bacterium]|jgi:hypothetical protein